MITPISNISRFRRAAVVTSLVAALVLVEFGCCSNRPPADSRSKGPIDPQTLFVLLKDNKVDDLIKLLPSESDLLQIYRSRPLDSAPGGFLPPQMGERLGWFSWDEEKGAKRLALLMRETLRRNIQITRKTCEKRGFSWENAQLKKVNVRNKRERVYAKEQPFERGLKDDLIILYLSDGRLDIKVRFTLVGDSHIGSEVFLETLSDEERARLRKLRAWASHGSRELANESPETLFAILLRHELRKSELVDWLNLDVTKETADRWICEGRGPGLKHTLEIRFGEDDIVSEILLDGKAIEHSPK
jgi:hypothetical protein